MWTEILLDLLGSFVAAVAFGALLNAPKKALVVGGLLGVLGYMVYVLLQNLGINQHMAMFVSAFLSAMGAQIASRKLRMIATVFVIMAIFPLVPGLGLYRAMRTLAQEPALEGLTMVVENMGQFFMLALGLALGTGIFGRAVPKISK